MLHPWTTSSQPRTTTPFRLAINETPVPAISAAPPPVWLVESTAQADLYSNGLRAENQFATTTSPRKYIAYSLHDASSIQQRDQPAGIVFHTTESHLVPFEEQQNRALRREGEGLLEYVKRQRAYHFVIDRFGRVFRIVQETDYANHAGNSIWADEKSIYLNLNQSFFGVAFEARSNPDGRELPVNGAQVHAGRILVEMLRSRYSIPASNCVAHAQVSVNPTNGRAGYHTDWAANLPFTDLGLTDNYTLPLPSVELFGFQPDDALLQTGGHLQQGIDAAAESVRRAAAARHLPVEKYRRILLEKYRHADRTHTPTL